MTPPPDADSEAGIAARGLTRYFGDQPALVDMDLDVAPGEAVALLGANGSGKTTALRCIAGQLTPSAGTVAVAGGDPGREPDGETVRRRLAFVPDTPVFYRELTVAEHLRLVAAAFDDADGADRGETVLGELGLTDRLSARPHELSSGQRQKVLLACTHARPFSILLLDEPVLRLDPGSQAWLHARLRAHRDAGTTVVLTTHQPAFATGLARRAVCLEDGRIVVDTDFDAFLDSGHAARIGAHPALPDEDVEGNDLEPPDPDQDAAAGRRP